MHSTRFSSVILHALAVGLLFLGIAGCDSSSSNPLDPTTTDNTDVPTVTVTVTGGFGMLEVSDHQFTAIADGFARMTLTELEPLDTVTIGLGIGQSATTTDAEGAEVIGDCVLLASDQTVRLGDSLLSSGLFGGIDYCVAVFDVGNLFEGNAVTYTLTIEHT